MSTDVLVFTEGFLGDVIGPIPVEQAVRRVVAFCASTRSGFIGYDLAGYVARTTGRLTEIGPWTILLADALAGQVSVANVDGFALQVDKFAELLSRVPDKDLAMMNDEELGRVVEFCSFGFPGAWAPKITKAGALFRPRAVPILDGYLALAFGYSRDGFSVGIVPRHRAIEQVVGALARGIRVQKSLLDEVRNRSEDKAPLVELLSDVRLTDIIIWTAQDDRLERSGKAKDAWLLAAPGESPDLESVRWVTLRDASIET